MGAYAPPYARRESGGRSCRQLGQIRKEAAVTISFRVVPAPTFSSPVFMRELLLRQPGIAALTGA